MNGSVFSKARNMNGVGFEILARTPVPKLPLSHPHEICMCIINSSLFFFYPKCVVSMPYIPIFNRRLICMSHVELYTSANNTKSSHLSKLQRKIDTRVKQLQKHTAISYRRSGLAQKKFITGLELTSRLDMATDQDLHCLLLIWSLSF